MWLSTSLLTGSQKKTLDMSKQEKLNASGHAPYTAVWCDFNSTSTVGHWQPFPAAQTKTHLLQVADLRSLPLELLQLRTLLLEFGPARAETTSFRSNWDSEFRYWVTAFNYFCLNCGFLSVSLHKLYSSAFRDQHFFAIPAESGRSKRISRKCLTLYIIFNLMSIR